MMRPRPHRRHPGSSARGLSPKRLRHKPDIIEGDLKPRHSFRDFMIARLPAIFIFLVGVGVGIYLNGLGCDHDDFEKLPEAEVEEIVLDLVNPVRPAPETFKRDTTWPRCGEGEASGSIVNGSFSAGRDLVYVDDPRVWWESDHDGTSDDECDHSMHAAMEIPFRRLVNLLCAVGWQPRVQEAYRASGTHADRSLHKEGRALDITVDRPVGEKLTHFEKIAAYEELAKLAWQAGFDWVYYENSRGTGPHIHASVRADGPRMPASVRADGPRMPASVRPDGARKPASVRPGGTQLHASPRSGGSK
ncbi:MAG: hypothetical protein ACOX9C_04845 [Kiritimatiellia bacterium]|jgi:hypothetical protein